MRRREDMTFAPEEYERRVRELRERMAARELDAVIISDPENLMYLTDHQTTGYSFFQALIVPLEAEPVMITRALEESNVVSRTWLEHSRAYPDSGDAILELVSTLRDLRLADSRVGYERNSYYFPPTSRTASTTPSARASWTASGSSRRGGSASPRQRSR